MKSETSLEPLDSILSEKDAVYYMSISPAHANSIFQNKRIMDMLYASGQSDNVGIPLRYYQGSCNSRPSFYMEIDKATGKSFVFEPSLVIKNKDHGSVRQFTHKEGKSVIVKTMTDPTEHDHVINEARIMKRVYSSSKTCLFKLLRDQEVIEHRLVEPLISGERADLFLFSLSDIHGLCHVIYAITTALMMLHRNGVIHGDFKLDNILIDKISDDRFVAHIIDFGLSYLLTDRQARFFETDEVYPHIGPERINCDTPPAPDVNQDVFSLGYMLKMIMEHYTSRDLIQQTLPLAVSFMEQALDPNPLNRPTLTSFYEQFSEMSFFSRKRKYTQGPTHERSQPSSTVTLG
ncbi:MAG: protein kinase domain-containing protein [Legionellaceae bacterium]